MQSWFEGDDVGLMLEFEVDGEFVSPSSVSVVVRDLGGRVLHSEEPEVEGTGAFVTVPGEVNTVPEGVFVTEMLVQYRFVLDGRTHSRVVSYRVTPFLPITATAAEVRRELGLDRSELPDQEVDLVDALIMLQNEVQPDLVEALKTPGWMSSYANRALVYRTGLDLVESFRFRVAVSMKAEENAANRMAKFSVDEIRAELAAKLTKVLDGLQQQEPATRTHLALATPTDAITGG